MNKTLSFLKLDYVTLRPYLSIKNLVIMLAASSLFTIESSTTPIAIFMMYGFIFSSYCFAAGDKCDIDELYVSLSISRNSVVTGRYLFILLLNLCFGILAYASALLIPLFLHKSNEPKEALFMTLILFFVLSFFNLMQLPVFFKLGYAKGKVKAYTPLIVLAFLLVLISRYLKDAVAPVTSWIAENRALSISAAILIWMLAIWISRKVALLFYEKRDF